MCFNTNFITNSYPVSVSKQQQRVKIVMAELHKCITAALLTQLFTPGWPLYGKNQSFGSQCLKKYPSKYHKQERPSLSNAEGKRDIN